MAEPAAHEADAGGGEAEDPVGDPRRVHDVAHQDEQRRREQRKGVGGLRDLLRHDAEREAAEEGEGDGRQPHRDEERHPYHQRQEPDRQDLQHQRRHSACAPGSTTATLRPASTSPISASACRISASAAKGMTM